MTPLPQFMPYSTQRFAKTMEEGPRRNSFEVMDTAQQRGHCGSTMAEVQLSQELLSVLCGRSRRRLRDIQSSCQVSMKLDRVRGILRIFGPEPAIQAARWQLSSLGGPRKDVPAAVWAELFRTRTQQTSKEAIVLYLQELSGCRIHIERSRHEVRIFGPQDGVAAAEKLLEELDRRCLSEALPIEDPDSLDRDALDHVVEGLSEQLGITVQVSDAEVLVLGLEDRVVLAVRELMKYMKSPETYQTELSPGDIAVIEAAWPVLSVEAPEPSEPGTHGGGSSSHDSLPTPPSMPVLRGRAAPVPQLASMQSQQPGQMPRQQQPLNTCGPTMGQHPECCVCPTCGVGRYCHFCGQQTWVYIMDGSSIGMISNAPTPRPEQRVDAGSAHSSPKAGWDMPGRATMRPLPPTPPDLDDDQVGGMWMAMPTAPETMPTAMQAEAAGVASSGRGNVHASCMVGPGANGMVMGGMIPMCFPMSMAPDQAQQMPWVGNVPVTVANGYQEGVVNGSQMVRHIYMVPAFPQSLDESQQQQLQQQQQY